MDIGTIGIIISYLDRCTDIPLGNEVYSFFSVTKDEKNIIEKLWLSESHIQTERIKGTKSHFMNGKKHREEKDENGLVLPTIIYENGSRYWYRNGELHRDEKDENGLVLPAIIYTNGDRKWYNNGKCHRECKDENGLTLPAYMGIDGTRWWYRNGNLHRDGNDLPVIIYADGSELLHYEYTDV